MQLFDTRSIIGKGTSGIVTRGSLEVGGEYTDVAIKRYLTSGKLTDKHILREIWSLLYFNNPGILKPLLIYMEKDKIVLVVPLYEKTLREYIGTESEKLYISSCLVNALAYIHSVNYIHRDLKSENIFLKPNVCIGDLGLCRINATHDFPGSPNITTPYVRAPEVLNSILYGPEIDCWALGIVLKELWGKELDWFAGLLEKDPVKRHKAKDIVVPSSECLELLASFKTYYRGEHINIVNCMYSAYTPRPICFSPLLPNPEKEIRDICKCLSIHSKIVDYAIELFRVLPTLDDDVLQLAACVSLCTKLFVTSAITDRTWKQALGRRLTTEKLCQLQFLVLKNINFELVPHFSP
jgi:serine/threonine protein kinase